MTDTDADYASGTYRAECKLDGCGWSYEHARKRWVEEAADNHSGVCQGTDHAVRGPFHTGPPTEWSDVRRLLHDLEADGYDPADLNTDTSSATQRKTVVLEVEQSNV